MSRRTAGILSFVFWILFTIAFAALLASCGRPDSWTLEPGNSQTVIPAEWQSDLDRAASAVSSIRNCGSPFGGTVKVFPHEGPIDCPNPAWHGCTLAPYLISVRMMDSTLVSTATIWELCNACAENKNRTFTEAEWTAACNSEATALYLANP